MFRKMAPAIALLFLIGVACTKTTPTTSTEIASPPPSPSPSPTPSTSITQQQAISLISAMTADIDNLNSLSGYLTDLNKAKSKGTATDINTSMSTLKNASATYKQANWDSTGQLYNDFYNWVTSTFSFSNDVANSKGTSEYASWSKKATQLANQGNSLKTRIANATGLGSVPPPPSPSA